MSDVKILKSIDITSYTIMGTGIGVLFSVLFSIILLIAIGILSSSKYWSSSLYYPNNNRWNHNVFYI